MLPLYFTQLVPGRLLDSRQELAAAQCLWVVTHILNFDPNKRSLCTSDCFILWFLLTQLWNCGPLLPSTQKKTKFTVPQAMPQGLGNSGKPFYNISSFLANFPFTKLWFPFTQLWFPFTLLRFPFTQLWFPFTELWFPFLQLWCPFTQVWFPFTQLWYSFTQLRPGHYLWDCEPFSAHAGSKNLRHSSNW